MATDSSIDAAPALSALGAACDDAKDCASEQCVDGVCCESACEGTCVACAIEETGVDSGTCAPVPDRVVCRALDGPCDVEETCSAGVCPSDAVITNIEQQNGICRPSVSGCDVREVCDGVSKQCPADVIEPSGTICNLAAGPCDVEETCDGVSNLCPEDVRLPQGSVCGSSEGPCDVQELCDGVSAECPTNVIAQPGTVCRPAAGPCDEADVCDGTHVTCGDNLFVAAGTTCRAASGTCDVAETCSGVSAQCPSNTLRGAGFTCRASAGSCDVAETCSGSSGTCPTDAFNANLCMAGFYCSTAGDCIASPKRVFVSSTTHNGNWGTLAAADSACSALAENAGLSGVYKAWLSIAGNSASARMTHSTGVYQLVNGVKVADNWNDLTDGTLDATINRTETGAGVPSNEPFTGTTGLGAHYTGYDCAGWTSAAGNVFGAAGISGGALNAWSSGDTNSCNTLARFYCFEQ